eukprot:1137554-Pelagomonas_calceolata.AAC.3
METWRLKEEGPSSETGKARTEKNVTSTALDGSAARLTLPAQCPAAAAAAAAAGQHVGGPSWGTPQSWGCRLAACEPAAWGPAAWAWAAAAAVAAEVGLAPQQSLHGHAH